MAHLSLRNALEGGYRPQSTHHLMTIKDWIGRLARWALFLQEFEFEIEYKKGATHANADVLSRPILLVTTRKSANEVELPLKFDDSHDYIALMHLLGHFQAETTFERPKDFYFWKKMMTSSSS